MKISSASKKVLASALSAAMVVAFAPTVAFAGTSVVAKNSYVSAANGQTVEVDYYDAGLAFEKAGAPEKILDGNKNALYNADKATIALADDVTVTKAIADDDDETTALTVDLGGKTLTSKAAIALSHKWEFTTAGEGTIAAAGTAGSTFAGVTVGTEDAASNVTLKGGTYTKLAVAAGSTVTLDGATATAITAKYGSNIAIKSGTVTIAKGDAETASVVADALRAASNDGAEVKVSSSAYDGGDIDVSAEAATVSVSANVFSVDGAPYSTLSAALAAAEGAADKTVYLQSDLTEASAALTNGKVAPNAAATINLNGHTLDRVTIDGSKAVTLAGTGKLTGVTTTGTVNVAESADVTVDTSAARASVKGDKAVKPTLGGTLNVTGKLTIADDADTSDAAVAVKASGTAVITKAHLASLSVEAEGSAAVADGAFSGAITVNKNAASFSIAKGTYAGTAELAAKYIAAGSVVDEYASNKYEVGAPVATAQKVTKAQDGKTEYKSEVKCASLQGASYNASDKTTVALTADVEGVQTVGCSDEASELTIDFAGHSVRGGIVVNSDAAGDEITLKGGSVTGVGTYAIDAQKGKVTVEGGAYAAEAKTVDGKKTNPKALTNVAASNAKLYIAGGTFKDATFKVNATAEGITGGTFDKKPTALADNYSAIQNADGTYTVSLGGIKAPSFGAVNGVIKVNGGDTFKVADKDKALEQAVVSAYSKVLTTAWSADPKATSLAGFEFAKNDDKTSKKVEDLTAVAGNAVFALDVAEVTADADKALKADKDYSVDSSNKVAIAVKKADDTTVIGYLTGIAVDVTYAYAQDTASWTYKFLGADNAKYDAANKAYTFSTTTGAQFGVEKISNSILELQEQMKAQQDKDALAKVKGKTVKAKAKKKTTAKLTVVTSETGSVSTFKKTSGNKKITVSKAGKVTVKKGLKAGKTYTAKVKATVGTQTKTIKVTVKVSK